MQFHERLSLLKSRRGLTTDRLSELSGVPKGTLNKLLNGETRNPTGQTLARLADALGCSVENLCPPPPGVIRASELLKGAQPAAAERVPEPRRVPVLGGIAAGRPIFTSEDAESILTFEEGCDFALVVHGDSMVGARIQDGDIVFIHRQDDVYDGQIAAVVIDGEATLKRVYHLKDGVQLLSENPKYAPMVYTAQDADSIRIIGKAVGFQSQI